MRKYIALLVALLAAPAIAGPMHQGPYALVAYAQLSTNTAQALLLDVFDSRQECEAAKQTEVEAGRVPLGVTLFCTPVKENI